VTPQHISWTELNSVLSLDVMDASGEVQTDVTSTMFKTRLDENGKTIGVQKLDVSVQGEAPPEGYCGPCYGGKSSREDGCCNTCQDVRNAYQAQGWAITDYDNIEQCARERYQNPISSFPLYRPQPPSPTTHSPGQIEIETNWTVTRRV